jgi:hypothetical protein
MPLRPGNTKLGPLVHQWSIPSGLQHICVGATALCLALCYAMRQHYCRSTVKNAMEVNYDLSLRLDFAIPMGKWIRSVFARVVRVHASGEFYDVDYVQKWIEISTRNPNVMFYAYTRSWRSKALLPALKELARQPNFLLWFSCDKESGAPPVYKHVRRAYMVDDTDLPSYRVDLIFRHRTSTVRKWVKNTLVCPAENGVTSVTCSKCQLCFKYKPIPQRKQNVQYPELSRA